MPDLPKPLKPNVNINKKILEFDDIDWEYSVYENDKQMFETVIEDLRFQADQWKIYPNEVVDWTELKEEYNRGLHKSYAEEIIDNPFKSEKKKKISSEKKFTKLHELLIYVKSIVPKHIRLNRIIRDIPSTYIHGGADDVSMRQVLQIEMGKRGLKCKCIRCIEVKKQKIDNSDAILLVHEYEASEGIEYFLSFESPDEQVLFGFLCLRLSAGSGKKISQSLDMNEETVFPELIDCALIRELHVYGQTTPVKRTDRAISSDFPKRRILQDCSYFRKWCKELLQTFWIC